MAQPEAHPPLRECTDADAIPETHYRELIQIKISDNQRASKFHITLTHGSGASEEFTTSKKAREAAVPCNT